MTRFASPWPLLLLVFVPLYLYVELRFRAARRPAVRFPDLGAMKIATGRRFGWKRYVRLAVRAAALSLLILAVA
ncbi:MAG: BatA domain-containing protein, partial [Candidatus Eisenbacteria bacterium]|nr:BatA domain-containing protein [Candidatus Eisenbacteria bacterium]